MGTCPLDSAAANMQKGLRVFLLEAGQENEQLVKGEADRMAKLLIAEKIPVQLSYAPGTHSGEYAIAQEPAVSAFLQTAYEAGAPAVREGRRALPAEGSTRGITFGRSRSLPVDASCR